MKSKASLFSSALLLAYAASCAGTDSKGPATGSTQAGEMVCDLAQDNGKLVLHATDANDYTFSSTLTLGDMAVAPRSDLTFDWSRVNKDIIYHSVDPLADIDMVSLIVWKLTPADLAAKLNADSLQQQDFEAIATVYTNNMLSSTSLFDFTEFNEPVPQDTLLSYLDPAQIDPMTHAYTVMAVTGTTPGKGTRMVESFHVDPSSTNTQVSLASDSASLSYEVDLTSLQSVQVPAGEANISIDWSGMQNNALGRPFEPTYVTQVMVAKYSMSLDDLQKNFLDLELIADTMYQGQVTSGASFPLSATKTDKNEPFTGIDDSGTWLLALSCGTCTNPAPWFITVLKTCGGQAAQDAGP